MRLIGDVPIYVAPASADHVRHPELFRDDVVAGVPPDAFTAKGQLWGNPIYDWPRAAQPRATAGGSSACAAPSQLFDLARIDHFRAFVRLLGGAGRRARRVGRALGARTRPRRRSTPRSASSAGCR